MGLSPGCHLGDSPETSPVTSAGTALTWLSLASQGAGCGQDTGCSAGWWLHEGTAVPEGWFPSVQVTQRKQPQNERSWHVPTASLGIVPAASRLSPLLSQAALGISSAEKWSILTHLGKKREKRKRKKFRREKKKSKPFAPARLKIGAVSFLGKANLQLPTEDWAAPGSSTAGYPEVLPHFPVPGCTGSLLGRGSSPKKGLLLCESSWFPRSGGADRAPADPSVSPSWCRPLPNCPGHLACLSRITRPGFLFQFKSLFHPEGKKNGWECECSQGKTLSLCPSLCTLLTSQSLQKTG